MTTKTTRTPSRLRPTTGSERRNATRLALIASTALTPAAAVADALPTGGQVVQGAAQIAQPSSSQVTINQSSNRAVINWHGFSVGQGNAVTFNQPSSNSATLNRVTGGLPSRIDGSINANGHVYLVNPRGVVVGPTGRVDAQGFVASSLQTDDEDFMQGRLTFEGNGNSAGIANHGTITVGQGGMAALLGGKVENTGTIVAPMGKIGFGAGEQATIDLTGDGFLQIAMPSDSDTEVLINQAGRVSADGGLIEMQAATAREAARRVVNLSGVTEARSVSGRNGHIVLGGGAGGTVRVTGTVNTSQRVSSLIVDASPRPAERPGGDITITGRDIEIAPGAEIRADAPTGGGSIRIGGDLQGTGPLQRATTLVFEEGATVSASATDAGDGGYVILWSDTDTTAFGKIRATGGPAGGDGGFIEVSSPLTLRFAADVSAAGGLGGAPGELLLDPTDILVCTAGPGCVATDPGVETTDEIEAILGVGTNVTLNTSDDDLNGNDLTLGIDPGDILIDADLSWGTAANLTLIADTDIDIDAAVTATGTGGFFANATRFLDIGVGGSVEIVGAGQATLTAVSDINTSGPITMGDAGATVSLDSGNNILLGGPVTGPGTFRVEAIGEITTTPSIDPLQNGNVDVGTFRILGGAWVQNNATNPDFDATDFGMSSGTTFLRVFDGDGTPADPYEIQDVFGLQGINSPGTSGLPGDPVLLTAAWELGNNIDASGTTAWIPEGFEFRGFRPIGDNTDFTGSLDGAGFEISGLYMDRGSQAGLFASTNGAQISDLVLSGIDVRVFDIESATQAGGLIADATDTDLTNISVGGTVIDAGGVGADLVIGGVVGEQTGGTLDSVSYDGIVEATISDGASVTAGGVIGVLNGDFASSTIDVEMGDGNIVGGPASRVEVDGTPGSIVIGGAIGSINTTGNTTVGRTEAAAVSTTVNFFTNDSSGFFSSAAVGGVVGSVTASADPVVIRPSSTTVGVTVGPDGSGSLLVAGGLVGGNAANVELDNPSSANVTVLLDGDVSDAAVGVGVGEVEEGATLSAFTLGATDVTGSADVTTSGNMLVGGLAGENRGTVSSLDVDATLTTDNTSTQGAFSNSEVGLGAGRNGGIISNVVADGAIDVSGRGEFAVGGMAGTNDFGDPARIETSTVGAVTINVGTSSDRVLVEATGADVGGFVGLNALDIISGATDADVNVFTDVSNPLDEGFAFTNVGGFVGRNNGGIINGSDGDPNTVDGAFATGDVTVDALGNFADIGGFVGRNQVADITIATASGSVSGTSNIGASIGGFAGSSLDDGEGGESIIRDAKALGATVSFTQDATEPTQASSDVLDAGGFVGINESEISRASADGNVTVSTIDIEQSTGGFAGVDNGEISDVYARGDVTSTGGLPGNATGGLVGVALAGSTIDGALSTGAVSTSGGFGLSSADIAASVGTTFDIFFDSDTAGISGNVGTGLTTAILQSSDTGSAILAALDATEWAPGATGIYPQLYTIDPVVFALPDDVTITYNDAPPAFTGTVTGGPANYVFDTDTDTLDTSAVFASLTAPGTDVLRDVSDAVIPYDLTAAATTANSSQGIVYDVIYGVADYTINPIALTIETLDQTKTFGDDTFVLDETEGVGWQVTAGTLVPGDIDSVELDSPGEAPGVAVGDYAIDAVQANGTGVGNYTITFDEIGILTVEALGVLIEIQVETLDQTKTYGDGTFALDETEGVGWVINGSTPFIGGDGIDSIELTSAGEAVTAAVGVYSIEAGAVTGTGLDNYNIDIVITESGVLTVVPLAIDLTITTLDQAKTYGTSFSLDETEGVGWVQTGSGGFVNGDALTGVILSSDGAAADADATAVVGAPYEIEVAGLLGPGINNYTITFENDGELTVFRAPLEISTLDQTKTFGDDTFALAETEGAGWEVSSGTIFFDGDITGVTLDSEGEAPLADAGVFAIDAGPASGDGVGNYDITFQEVGRLTVEELEVVLDVEIDTLNQTKTYGDADFTLAETDGTGWVIVGDDPFLGDDGITTIDLASEGEAVTAGVGIYDIIAGEISGTGLENYEITVNAVGTLTVDPRAIDLTVTTLDQVKTYGVDFALNDAEGVGWVTSGEGGFVNGDALTGVVLSSDATVATAPATDAIGDAALIEVVELLGPGIENYTITFANEGALTVLRAPLEITTLDQTKEFGDETFALAETEGAGWAITDGTLFNNDVIGTIELSSEGEAETAPVGTFDITTGDINGFGLENYDIALVADGVLTVDPRVISILVRTLDQAKTYGEAEFALAETEGLGWVIAEGAFEDGDGIDLVPLGSDGEAVTAAAGVYDIFQDGDIEGSGLSNYDIDVSTTGELTVAQAPLTITANDQSKVEGEALTFDGTEFTVTGLLDINDDAVTSVDLFSAGADAEASADDSPFEIALSNPVGRGLSNYAITEESGSLTVAAEDDRPDVIVPPRQPNLPTQGDTRITDGNGGDSGAIGGGTTSTEGTVATQTGAQSIEVAESVLAVIDRASSDLEAAVSSCRESDLLVTDFLGCVSASLDTFSASLDPANLDLPQELASVSAAVIVARQGVDAARARAVSRLAGVTDQAERRQIELDAVAEARSALQTAGAEVTKAIGLLRADDPELASVYRAQADTVIAALNSVEVDLQRAVGL